MTDTPTPTGGDTGQARIEELLALADRAPGATGDSWILNLVDDLATTVRALVRDHAAVTAERDELRAAGDAAATELAKWGHGDFHYGPQEQKPSVVEAVNAWWAARAALGDTP
jgi:hypothetical protein